MTEFRTLFVSAVGPEKASYFAGLLLFMAYQGTNLYIKFYVLTHHFVIAYFLLGFKESFFLANPLIKLAAVCPPRALHIGTRHRASEISLNQYMLRYFTLFQSLSS